MCQRLNDISIEIGAVENKIDYRFSDLGIGKEAKRREKSAAFHLMMTFYRRTVWSVFAAHSANIYV